MTVVTDCKAPPVALGSARNQEETSQTSKRRDHLTQESTTPDPWLAFLHQLFRSIVLNTILSCLSLRGTGSHVTWWNWAEWHMPVPERYVMDVSWLFLGGGGESSEVH